ncbi:SDR family oxidoreductase [Dyadobacter tibetensis]|uniref:SDR family oxidoreductase n=1 Tax=Dyadobacter tibetensis TaxID=1211851 RepID=UPI00046F5BF1|nr:SDR family oxidoreductase [Dyadobacter tibetensis]
MKILLTGVTGYIAQRLLPVLIENGHQVVCCVRDESRFHHSFPQHAIQVLEIDFLKSEQMELIPRDIQIAFYLIHSMSTSSGDFMEMEETCAKNFCKGIASTKASQIIYLSGIVNESTLSRHLTSRKQVETILGGGDTPLTTLRAGIIVGSGSASFEIIRDLVEKLPIMIAPRWLETRCQPIAIRNVLEFLYAIMGREDSFHKSYDIGGPDILTYKEMLLRFSAIRGLDRHIWVVPVMTPKISSYWLYFVTSTSYSLARNLVNSMKVEVICQPNQLAEMLGINLIGYDHSIKLAFDKIEQNQVISSWKDAQSSNILKGGLSHYIQVPRQGCFIDERKQKVIDRDLTLRKIWAIGGKTGWYYGDWLWEIRGFMDQLLGGVGMRRGRKSASDVVAGDALDFWRVLVANKEEKRLLLYAEMKLPGEAWLEFRLDEQDILIQTATFRPLGVLGRLYWYSVLPFHGFIFNGMLKALSAKP